MDAVATLGVLSKRLTEATAGNDVVELKDLLEWVRKGGLESLKINLVTTLEALTDTKEFTLQLTSNHRTLTKPVYAKLLHQVEAEVKVTTDTKVGDVVEALAKKFKVDSKLLYLCRYGDCVFKPGNTFGEYKVNSVAKEVSIGSEFWTITFTPSTTSGPGWNWKPFELTMDAFTTEAEVVAKLTAYTRKEYERWPLTGIDTRTGKKTTITVGASRDLFYPGWLHLGNKITVP
ncbi:Hypothetical protein POVN_LOCUS610 [uncultured virus]|nr:Hypothetical protein POVN_LOCUS610 [uncultured virus]